MPPAAAKPTGLVPHLVVGNAAKAIDFYKHALGAEEIKRMPDESGKKIMHAELKVGASILYLCDDFPEYCNGKSRTPSALGGTPVTIHQYVQNCDAAVKRAADAGATVTMPPQDMFWGDRYAQVTDPFGHSWSFATPLAR